MRLLPSLLLLLIVAPLAAQTLPQADQAYIDSIMTATYKPGEPGGVLLVAVNGKPVYRKAFGLASAELNVPNKPEFVFRVGSMSKQFTAVSMLQLAQAGKLSLTDEIRKYLPWYNTHGRAITIAHLLSHTSGIPSYTEKPEFAKIMASDISGRGIAEFVMDDSLLFEPGTNWSYSNSGFAIANLIIEAVSGVPFGEYLQEHIFKPIGMLHSTVGSNDRILPAAVSGYDRNEDGTFKPAMHLNWSWPYGGGQVLSNVDDMLAWDEALYTDKLLSKQWRQKAWTPIVLPNGEKTNYGYGWGAGTWDGLEIIEHGGAINGFLSDGIRIPEKHIYVIAFSNTTSVPPRFVPDIALKVAGRPLKTPAAMAVDAKTLQDYIGTYLVTRSGARLTTNATAEPMYRAVTVVGDTLFSQQSGGTKNALRPVGKDLFSIGRPNTYARFVRDAQAKVVAVEIYQEPLTIGPIQREPKTDLPLPEEKKEITLDAKALEKYRGKYQLVPGFVITVTTEGNRIFGQATGQSRFEMFPQSETVFFLKIVDASMEFVLNEKGEVVSAILNQGGKRPLTKIE
jgi:CubicO group peptidase (beta-lactamase class C family)